MRFAVFITIVLFLLNSCNSNRAGDQRIKKDSLSFRSDPIVSKFTLPYSEQLYADTNSLIFYYTKPFDTSFLVHLRKINDEISGTYHQTLPKFHRDLEGYNDGDIKFLFFDGFSFIINKETWDSITKNAIELLSKDDSIRSKVCFDCPSYFLAYSAEIRYDNRNNEIYFKQLAELLKWSIIDRINKIRREKFNGNIK